MSGDAMESQRLVLERERRAFTGVPTSSWYEAMRAGLAPPPVRISAARVAWVYGELAALNRARIRGASDDEIRRLVGDMLAARARAAA
jgi:prophage regulatory protein